MAGLDALVETTFQTLATDLATGRLSDVAWDVGHLGLAAHTRLGHKDNARRAGFAVWVAGVGRVRVMPAGTVASASVSALGDGCPTSNWRVEYGSATVARELIKRRVQARVAMTLVTEHLAGVNTTLQLLPADQGAGMGFLRNRVHLDRALGLRFGRAAAISTLVLSTRSKTTAGLAACWDAVAAGTVQIHIGADAVHMSRSAAAVNGHCLFAGRARSEMTILLTGVTTVKELLASVTAEWDGILTGGTRISPKQSVDRF